LEDHMKRSTSLMAACVLAVAALGPARAADISAPVQPLNLTDNTAGFFGDAFGINNSGNTFSDRFTFTVSDSPKKTGRVPGCRMGVVMLVQWLRWRIHIAWTSTLRATVVPSRKYRGRGGWPHRRNACCVWLSGKCLLNISHDVGER